MVEQVYFYCAVVGCTVLGLQVLLQVFGLFGEVGFDGGHGMHLGAAGDHANTAEGHGNAFFGFLSFKAISAFVGIFGLAGLSLKGQGFGLGGRLGLSVAAGLGGMILVGFLMRGLSRLQVSGTVRIANAVGLTATVYLKIPEAGKGAGKVTVDIKGRAVELEAVTDGPEIPTGARVIVEGLVGEETLRVRAL